MSSSDRSTYLDLDRDLPTTDADVAALRRLRRDRQLTFAEFLDMLSRQDLSSPDSESRVASEDWEPFRL